MDPHIDGGKDADIRHRAYLIWLAEGQPDGQAEQHWRLAEAGPRTGSDAAPEPDAPEPPIPSPS